MSEILCFWKLLVAPIKKDTPSSTKASKTDPKIGRRVLSHFVFATKQSGDKVWERKSHIFKAQVQRREIPKSTRRSYHLVSPVIKDILNPSKVRSYKSSYFKTISNIAASETPSLFFAVCAMPHNFRRKKTLGAESKNTSGRMNVYGILRVNL